MAGSSSSSSGNEREVGFTQTVVEDCGIHKSTCGYCHSNKSIAYGLLAHALTVDDYQELLDHGWRRSGRFLYKHDMERTCCPSYTIRLKVDDFVASKEQKRVQQKMQRYLKHTFDGFTASEGPHNQERNLHSRRSVGEGKMLSNTPISSISSSFQTPAAVSTSKLAEEDNIDSHISHVVDEAVKVCVEIGELPADVSFPHATVRKMAAGTKKKLKFSEELVYSSNIAFQIAACLDRNSAPRIVNDPDGNLKAKKPKKEISEGSLLTIAEKLVSKIETPGSLSNFIVQACNGHLNFILPVAQGNTSLDSTSSSRAVNTTTKASLNKIQSNTENNDLDIKNQNGHHFQERRLEIRMKKSTFEPEEFDLYKKYQVKVHGDRPEDVQTSSYQRFLVDTPLIYVPPGNDRVTPPQGFGSFHQQYLIDGQLIAVGVVDILPKCLSSKYLFWDPDLAFLSLGKFSALEEIKWVQEAQKCCPTLQHYYLGYYIHSCPKMRYKAAYNPSELLCPSRYEWVPFKIAKPLLDKSPYVCLSDHVTQAESALQTDSDEKHDSSTIVDHEMEDIEMRDSDFPEFERMDANSVVHDTASDLQRENIGNVLILLGDTRFQFKDLELSPHGRSWMTILARQLQDYVRVVGKSLSERMLYHLA